MERYERFLFESCRYDPDAARVELNYSLDGQVSFQEVLALPRDRAPVSAPDAPEVQAALFALFLAGGVSYYKTCCPRNIEVLPRPLGEDEAAFWSAVYENGLGEFFYRNGIDFRGLVRFPAGPGESAPHPSVPALLPAVETAGCPGTKSAFADSPHRAPAGERRPSPRTTAETRRCNTWGTSAPCRFLVPVGGGKDSVVTTELLKAIGEECALFRMGSHPLIDRVAGISGLPLLTVERSLSPALFELNRRGALNGHVPISAYVSCLAVLVALLYGYDFVAMSNERSASEGNVEFLGMEINHQWSKSLRFERMFQEYLARRVTRQVDCASLLRPFSELRIMQLFSEYPAYLPHATSCNRNWKVLSRPAEGAATGQRPWCGDCPKCAFCFALMAASIPRGRVVEAFGRSLFEEPGLLPLYRRLLGLEGFKPFECVGTPEETAAAFLLARRRGEWDEEPAMRLFVEEAAPRLANPDGLIREALAPSPDHVLPADLRRLLLD